MRPLEWTLAPTGTKASLRGIAVVSDRHVWASGTNGTVVQTLDGGAHWMKMSGLPADLDFRGLYTVDGKTILLMSSGSGEKSQIFKSVDAGRTWRLVHKNQVAEGFFDGIAFFNAVRGMVVGDPVGGRFFILTTVDGGSTWTPRDGPTAEPGEGLFAASNSSLVVTRTGLVWFGTGGVRGGRVYRSDDWGGTWSAASTTIPHMTASAGVFSLSWASSHHGFAVGGDYQRIGAGDTVLSETDDGGASWKNAEGPKGYRSAVVSDGRYVLVTGPSGTEMRSTPNSSWQIVSGDGFHAMSRSPKGKVIWACGGDGRAAYLPMR